MNHSHTISKQTSLLELKRAFTPEQYARFLQSQGKVFYWDAARFYVVTDYDLAKEVVKNPAFSADRSSFFVSRMPNLDLALIKDFFGIVKKMMVMSDGKEHESRRKAAALGIDGDLLEHFRPIIENTVKSLFAAAIRNGRLDFAKDIAEPLPSRILADLFGIEQKDRADFYHSALTMTRFFGGASQYRNEDGIEVNRAANHIKAFFQTLIEKRRNHPQRDFFSVLLANQEKFHLSDEEILSQAVMMLVAGQVTTTDQLNNNAFTMIETGSVTRLRREPEILPLAIEEFNRLDPGVTYLFRTVKAPIKLGEVHLNPEDVVFLSNHAINRDPNVFENPHHCTLDRRHNPHFAYGHGSHFCLGARLARIQMLACFQELLKLEPSFDPENLPVRNHYALAFSGFESIPLTVTRNHNTKEKP